jgi:hypothetical protein
MTDEEIWRRIEEFPDYLISNYGQVVHVDRPNTPRSVAINHQGFPSLVLFKKEHPGSRYLRQVNKLVATTFVPQTVAKLNSVWHKDGDFLNCHADNLKWDLRARVMEWNEMNRDGVPKFRTGRVMDNKTGRIYENAFELALHIGATESEVVRRIEAYPAHLEDRAPYKYVD